VKRSSVLSYSREALEMEAACVIAIASAEGLDAHADAVALRLEMGDGDDTEDGVGL
jgi:histidinol dehydrogenase